MDTIRGYLNNLFLTFPETPEVIRAKEELLEMMEDKYEECLREGKSEDEAIGTVVSEFGNIEEIAEELGISQYLTRETSSDQGSGQESGQIFYTFQTKEMVNEFVQYAWRHAWMIAAGIGCFLFNGLLVKKIFFIPITALAILILACN